MKQFTVYKHPVLGFEAVKVGWSWPAFFLVYFWLLIKQMWLLSAVWFAIFILLAVLPAPVWIIGSLLGWFYVPFKGNEWRVKNLLRRGYTQVSMVEAETPDAAIAKTASGKL